MAETVVRRCSVKKVFLKISQNSLAWLRAHMPTCLACSHPHVPTCLVCLRAQVSTCQRALRAWMLTCQRVLRAYMLTYQRSLRAYLLTCYRALHALVLTCQRTLSAYAPHVSTCLESLASYGLCNHVNSRQHALTSLLFFSFFQFYYHCCWGCTHCW